MVNRNAKAKDLEAEELAEEELEESIKRTQKVRNHNRYDDDCYRIGDSLFFCWPVHMLELCACFFYVAGDTHRAV